MKKDKFISFDGTNQTFADIETNTKKLSIFNVYVPMKSQEQCDRMKQVCIDNGLPYEKGDYDFTHDKTRDYEDRDVFRFSPSFNTFSIWLFDEVLCFDEVTEQEFMNLLKDYKDELR